MLYDANYVKCINWRCPFNFDGERCTQETIKIDDYGMCDFISNHKQSPRKKFKIVKKKGSNIPEQESIPPMPKVNQPKLSDEEIKKIADQIWEQWEKVRTPIPYEPVEPNYPYIPTPQYPYSPFWYGNPYEITCQTNSTYTINNGEENKNDNSKSK